MMYIGLPCNDINWEGNHISKVHDKRINKTDRSTNRLVHTHTSASILCGMHFRIFLHISITIVYYSLITNGIDIVYYGLYYNSSNNLDIL